MPRVSIAVWLACGALAAAAEPAPAPAVALNGHHFHLGPGLALELAAGPPLVQRPITADFDETGRLYVADSSGSNEKVEIQLQKKPHRIVRLEDRDGDGRFDHGTVYADGMMFPEGTLWHRGSLYVAAPPHIWKLTDTDDDGVADRREIWFDGKTLTGCANDLHGPYLGPDGWIYWCKGAFARQNYTLHGGKSFSTRASHIFRARLDGSGLEPVMTGGMDNPVDTVFTAAGERILTTTFLQHPAAGLRDGLIHAIYGGIYGKPHDPIYEPDHKWTSPDLMPVLTHLGPAAPCGLALLEADFGLGTPGNLLACQFNLRKVSRHVLKVNGATYTTEDDDFLVSDSSDFHPTDVLEDADGSVLVLDTGGWYKLCCPSSQLAKADVLGAIYRVKKAGVPAITDPRGRKIAWNSLSAAALAALFGDRRPAVRRRAMQRLAEHGEAALPVLKRLLEDHASNPQPALCAVWTACRIESGDARALLRAALDHDDTTVRLAALHSIALFRDRDALPWAIALLKSQDLRLRRAAAEVLGRLGDQTVIPALLETLRDESNDRVTDHSLTYALIELGDCAELRAAVGHADWRVRRAALAAADQCGAEIEAQMVLSCLDDDHVGLRDTARWIAGRRTDWQEELAAYLRGKLQTPPQTEAERVQLVDLLSRLAATPAVERLLAETAADTARAAAGIALQCMARAGRKEMPAAWSTAFCQALRPDSPVHAEALAALRAVPWGKSPPAELVAALRALAESSAPAETRLAALAALPTSLSPVSAAHFELLLAHLDQERPPALRGMAADVLGRASLSAEQLSALTRRLSACHPLELDRLLAAYAQSKEESVGLELVAALKANALREALNVESIRQKLAKYGPAVQSAAQELYSAIDAANAQQRARLEEILAALPPGDIRRGQAVFNSSKTSCRACHTIGYVGGKIGPDLTRIGQIRTQRDLLESILFPSLSFVRSYEPVSVLTTDGQQFSGIVKSDTPQELVLTVAADKEVRIPRNAIEDMEPGKISVMPAGLEKQLSLQEFADLVEFLKACK